MSTETVRNLHLQEQANRFPYVSAWLGLAALLVPIGSVVAAGYIFQLTESRVVEVGALSLGISLCVVFWLTSIYFAVRALSTRNRAKVPGIAYTVVVQVFVGLLVLPELLFVIDLTIMILLPDQYDWRIE